METKTLTVTEVAKESFARFGTLVDGAEGLPLPVDQFAFYRERIGAMSIPAGQVSVGILQLKPRAFSFHEMERHVETPEMLVVLAGEVIVPVAPATHPAPGPELEQVVALRIRQGQAMIMNEGVWHGLPLILGDHATLLVVFKAGTPDQDFQLHDFAARDGLEFKLSTLGGVCL